MGRTKHASSSSKGSKNKIKKRGVGRIATPIKKKSKKNKKENKKATAISIGNILQQHTKKDISRSNINNNNNNNDHDNNNHKQKKNEKLEDVTTKTKTTTNNNNNEIKKNNDIPEFLSLPKKATANIKTETSIIPQTQEEQEQEQEQQNTFESNHHPWEINPKWNIERPKEGEKTMIDFCTKYKSPAIEKDSQGNIIHNPSSSALLRTRRLQAEAKKKKQKEKKQTNNNNEEEENKEEEEKEKGPKVRMINGEI